MTFSQGQAEVPTSHLRRCKARTEGNKKLALGEKSQEQWLLLWDFYGISMVFMGFLWDFYGFYGISMGFLWFLWDFYGISMGFLRFLWGFLWDFYGFYGISMVSMGISMGFYDFYGINAFNGDISWDYQMGISYVFFLWYDSWDFTTRSWDITSNCGYNGYPLVNVYIAMENHHAINGKIHYFNGPFSIAMLVHQRVCDMSSTLPLRRACSRMKQWMEWGILFSDKHKRAISNKI